MVAKQVAHGPFANKVCTTPCMPQVHPTYADQKFVAMGLMAYFLSDLLLRGFCYAVIIYAAGP